MSAPAEARVLVVREPWATAIVVGLKDLENRTWNTRWRGTLYIARAVGLGRIEHRDALENLDARGLLAALRARAPEVMSWDKLRGPGGIIGCAQLVDVVRPGGVDDKGAPHARAASPWYIGEHGFVLERAQRVPFVRAAGGLSIRKIPDDVRRELAAPNP